MKKATYDILGIGAPLLDQIFQVPEDYLALLQAKKGEMKLVDYAATMQILRTLPLASGIPIGISPGGSATNVIRVLAELGHACALIGNIGTDDIGQKITASLNGLQIHPLYTTTTTPTGQVICLVTPDGERTFRSYLGASGDIDIGKIPSKAFENTTLVHIEGYTLTHTDLAKQAMQYAKDNSSSKEKSPLISFDLANFAIVQTYRDEIMHLLKSYVDIVFCNAAEASTFTNLPPKEACMILKDICPIAVVSMGKEGCWIGQGDQLHYVAAFPKKAMDSTGAGDYFAAGFLHGILQGKTLPQSARMGALIAAAVVQVPGTTLSPATWHELKASL